MGGMWVAIFDGLPYARDLTHRLLRVRCLEFSIRSFSVKHLLLGNVSSPGEKYFAARPE
jgi:hypothetical protein